MTNVNIIDIPQKFFYFEEMDVIPIDTGQSLLEAVLETVQDFEDSRDAPYFEIHSEHCINLIQDPLYGWQVLPEDCVHACYRHEMSR